MWLKQGNSAVAEWFVATYMAGSGPVDSTFLGRQFALPPPSRAEANPNLSVHMLFSSRHCHTVNYAGMSTTF